MSVVHRVVDSIQFFYRRHGTYPSYVELMKAEWDELLAGLAELEYRPCRESPWRDPGWHVRIYGVPIKAPV